MLLVLAAIAYTNGCQPQQQYMPMAVAFGTDGLGLPIHVIIILYPQKHRSMASHKHQ